MNLLIAIIDILLPVMHRLPINSTCVSVCSFVQRWIFQMKTEPKIVHMTRVQNYLKEVIARSIFFRKNLQLISYYVTTQFQKGSLISEQHLVEVHCKTNIAVNRLLQMA